MASLLEGPWSRRQGLLWTCEVDVLVATRSYRYWWRVYTSGACAPLSLHFAHPAGSPSSLRLSPHGDTHPGSPHEPPSSDAISLTLGLPLHEDAEHHPAAWVVESTTGLHGLPDPVRRTLTAYPRLLGELRGEDVKCIRAYETVVTEHAPITLVGAWPVTSSSAVPTYRALPDTKAAAASEPSPDAYLFLGSREAWARWLDKEPRVARWLAAQLVVFVAVLITGITLLR